MDRKENFYFSDRDNSDGTFHGDHGNSYGNGRGMNEFRDRGSDYLRDDKDDYGYDGCGDDYDDDYDHDDDEIGYLNRELWEYEAEFDRAAREIERSHRSPAAKILTALIVVAAALAIYLGVSGYLGGEKADEPEMRVSFVWAGEEADGPMSFVRAGEEERANGDLSGIDRKAWFAGIDMEQKLCETDTVLFSA